ncbi:tRNA lysidine(34) synthetase TilS [Lutispora saccharofermentans]|uniref:tRNA(Ile)-lysidine synthase n=1 Tax=Lutispora saccharofermentans TaxID=3024236 RepID=A0ABT1NKZ7_9FIRM|nr:tRNA lysidine(34) synthetase TilS [Lutispora saccharofermentans]MCQ1530581.1 tRNA lysidine(34) synthetase TilS [Lutispora saccharofermentans]
MRDLTLVAEETIRKYNMLSPRDSVVVGLSGGPDSLCLLHVLLGLRESWGLKIYAAHLNHQFRGKDADDDAQYVKDICKEWDVEVFVQVFNVSAYAKERGLSSEEAGREIRYKLFSDVAEQVKAGKIAVAHNMNDNAETVLMNLFRGSGIEGLKGIEASRGEIIRPLINVSRDEIEAYCEEKGLKPRIDKTNLEPIYGRNKIRLELIPYIEKNFNASIMSTLHRLSDIVAIENDFLHKEAKITFLEIAITGENSIEYNINKLSNIHPALMRRVIRIGIEELLGSLKGIEYKNIEGVVDLLGKSTGAAVILPNNIKAYISYDKLILKFDRDNESYKYYLKLENDADNIAEFLDFTISLRSIDASQIADLKKDNKHKAYIDKAKIKQELVLRNRLEGDVFSPIGLKGTKKLKEYFIDEKIPKEERDNIFLIADGKEVVWILGKRLSDKYKITKNTKEAIMINMMRGTYDE